MSLGRLWAGRIFGTNTGNVFVKLEGEDDSLSGTLHQNEQGVALVVYDIRGHFDGNELRITGSPRAQVEGYVLGDLEATATLSPRGELRGEWSTAIGSAGTFVLFPHDQGAGAVAEASPDTVPLPDQLHTARHNFQAIEADRRQIAAIGEEIQRDFKKSQVVVTVVADTEQSRFLAQFKSQKFNTSKATIIKLFVKEQEESGLDRVAQVEFGPQVNMVMTQGGDEAWVLGMLEKLKRAIKPLERTYTTNIKKLGFGVNQVLLLGAIIYLPSLTSLRDRAIMIAAVLGLAFIVNWLHRKYLPFAAIYLEEKPQGLVERAVPTLASWLIAVTAGIVATLIAAYLQGWLSIPAGLGAAQ